MRRRIQNTASNHSGLKSKLKFAPLLFSFGLVPSCILTVLLCFRETRGSAPGFLGPSPVLYFDCPPPFQGNLGFCSWVFQTLQIHTNTGTSVLPWGGGCEFKLEISGINDQILFISTTSPLDAKPQWHVQFL